MSCLCRQTSAATFLGGKRRWGVHKKLESVSRQHPDLLIALGVVTTHTSFKTELCLAENPMGAFDCKAEIQTPFFLRAKPGNAKRMKQPNTCFPSLAESSFSSPGLRIGLPPPPLFLGSGPTPLLPTAQRRQTIKVVHNPGEGRGTWLWRNFPTPPSFLQVQVSPIFFSPKIPK